MQYNPGDYVRFADGRTGIVEKADKDGLAVYVEATNRRRHTTADRVEYLPPFEMSDDDVERWLTGEALYSELTADAEAPMNVHFAHPPVMDCRKMAMLLDTFIKTREEKGTELHRDYLDALTQWQTRRVLVFAKEKQSPFSNHLLDSSVLLGMLMLQGDHDYIIEIAIRECVMNRPFELTEKRLKSRLLEMLSEHDLPESLTDKETAILRGYTDELCGEGFVTAIKMKGYACYGGSRLYPCDWEEAKECLQLVYETIGDPACANSLGYIAYYGRCGTVDHEEAFKWFSIGAMAEITESRCKMSDMLVNGYATPENPGLAMHILQQALEGEKGNYMDGEPDNRLPEVLLRIGKLRMGEDGADGYRQLLMARLAMRERTRMHVSFGDEVTANAIQRETDNYESANAPEKSHIYGSLEDLLEYALTDHRQLRADIVRKNGRKYLSISSGSGDGAAFPVSCGYTGFCGRVKKLEVELLDPSFPPEDGKSVLFDEVSGDTLFFEDEEVMLTGPGCRFVPPRVSGGKKVRLAACAFGKDDEPSAFDYLCGEDVTEGMAVYVPTDGGRKRAMTTLVREVAENCLPMPPEMYREAIPIRKEEGNVVRFPGNH